MIHPRNCETCVNEKCEYFKYKKIYCTEGSYSGSAWALTRDVGCASHIEESQIGCFTEWMCKNGCDETECHFTVDYNAKTMYPDKCPMCSPGISPHWIRIDTKNITAKRFDYAFSKWLAGYFPKLSLKEHSSIVEGATGIASQVYCGMTVSMLEQFLKDHQHDSNEELIASLTKMLSNTNNEWYISYHLMEDI